VAVSLFLRWTLIQVLFVLAAGTLMVAYSGQVHMAGKVGVGVVLGIYGLASGYLGLSAWRRVRPAMRHVDLAVQLCPMVALCSTVSGFLIAFGGGAEDVQARVLGASTGLVATFAGIACSVVLMLQRHLFDA
jgi:hypothetical protein